MAEMMKAYRFEGVEKAALREVPIPEIGPDEILVKSRANGICHSDYEALEGRYVIPYSFPFTPGHEWSGEVVKVGENVTTYAPGDRVVGECVIGCGTCSICQSGNFTACPQADHFGYTIDGAVAEYLAARPEWLHKIPEGLDYETAAMVEPFSVAYYGIYHLGGTDASETVVVSGGGAIGSCAIAAAKAMGAKVILVEPQKYRQGIGKQLGADHIVDPTTEDAIQAVQDLTDGLGADLVVECSGTGVGLKSTFEYVKNAGRISFVSINLKDEIPTLLGNFQKKAITAKGSPGSPYVWDKVIAFLNQSKIDLSPIVTKTFPLAQADEAYKFARDQKSNDFIRVLVVNED
ncbi:MAG: zinc-dependent alcohol dehydrogenase [Lentihominibacter sp.]|jgi:threonine dehydrogenase-like Zn-dependent dehydrogenase